MIEFYNRYSGEIIILSILLPIIVCGLHYLFVGVKGFQLDDSANSIKRYSILERLFHFVRMVTFIIVTATGIYFVFREGSRSEVMIHSINGGIFLLISICTLFIWFKSGLFKKYDWIWLKSFGGYLSKKVTTLPAGKFNAGQKIFFWLTILLSIILAVTGLRLTRGIITQTEVNSINLVVHGIAAALLVVSVIGHIYLSMWVNKGTWRVLTRGKVSEEWSKCHHPNWQINQPSDI